MILTPDSATFNISEMQNFTRCRFRWWATWCANRIPRHESQPLAFGKLIHKIFEMHGGGKYNMVECIALYRREWSEMMENAQQHGLDIMDISMGTKVLKQLDDLTEALVQWHDIYTFDGPGDIETLEVEEPFLLPMGDGLFARGRPDRVAVRQGLLWHVQHKALAAGTKFAVFTDLAQRSYHEHLYMEALALKYPMYKVGGTQFDLIRKLKYRTKITKANPLGECKKYEEMFQQIPMSIDLESPVHEHVMGSIMQHAMEMRECQRRWITHGVVPAPNEGANGGFYGNAPDEYFRVLTGEIELDDDRFFQERTDTYAPTETETD